MSEKVHIFDTTLRDGDRSAGISLSTPQKLQIARVLASLGVDAIEAGFPGSGPDQLEAVRQIAVSVRSVTVCALARAVARDIDLAWEALRDAADPRIHLYVNAGEVRPAHPLRKHPEQLVQTAAAMVRRATSHTANVEFSVVDATRTEPGLLCAVVDAAIRAGAAVVNLPDSAGRALPQEIERMFTVVQEQVPTIHHARLSFHGHDDLGMSTANSLIAITAGARQLEVTMDGRSGGSGNTSLGEVVVAIHRRAGTVDVHTDIDPQNLAPASDLVRELRSCPRGSKSSSLEPPRGSRASGPLTRGPP